MVHTCRSTRLTIRSQRVVSRFSFFFTVGRISSEFRSWFANIPVVYLLMVTSVKVRLKRRSKEVDLEW